MSFPAQRFLARMLPLLVLSTLPGAAETASRPIRSVRTDRQALNVAAGETVTLRIEFTGNGSASIFVIDRDGYPVRKLMEHQRVDGSVTVRWDGRDDDGRLVPDEAYSLYISWHSGRQRDTYVPGEAPAHVSAIAVDAYDRRTGTLTYTLPRPSRVHVQAGTAVVDPSTRALVGPVMKTIVNREPRTGGRIAESWNGFDESGLFRVGDLEDFVVAVAASALPENSIITFGNRTRTFPETLPYRRGASLFHKLPQHEHHAGLRSEDDLSPALKIEPLNAVWSAAEGAWVTTSTSLRARLSVAGPTAAAFRKHPATLELFVDGRRVAGPEEKNSDVVVIPMRTDHELHRVSINWNSRWGPVAANTIAVRGPSQTTAGRVSL